MILKRLLTRQEINAKNARLLAELALETDTNTLFVPGRDDRNERLRGIPAVGMNVSGAMRGTRPDHAVR